MKKTRKQRWLDALRSGDYKQGDRYLCAAGRYCCLGVLAEIDGVLKHGPGRPSRVPQPECPTTLYAVGLYCKAPTEDRTTAFMLTEMNDAGVPFAEIADYIEENVEVLELEDVV